MRLILFLALVGAVGAAALFLSRMAAADSAFYDGPPRKPHVYTNVTVINTTTSRSECPSPRDCSQGADVVRVEQVNCGQVQQTHNKRIAANGGRLGILAKHECGQWPTFRIYMNYFGTRLACALPISYSIDYLYKEIRIWGPYQRTWSDKRGVFECDHHVTASAPNELVRNGRVDLHNGGSLPTWFGYRPNGCAAGAESWLAIAPVGRGLAAGERAAQYYTIYNHDCGKYSRFWFEYGGDSSWCPPRELSGNHEFIRYGLFEPGWCEVHGRNF